MEIGVISDTHGLLRPEAVAALQDVEHILHAGDVGDVQILEQLRAIAPVTVVRGNVDYGKGLRELPTYELVNLGGRDIYIRHILDNLDLNPAAAGISAVIYGHTHKPAADLSNGVLYLNPGSIGPRRFSLPISMAKLFIRDNRLDYEFITLE